MLHIVHQIVRAALGSLVALVSLCVLAAAQEPSATATSPLTAAQLDQLVAPIALYPDPVVAQVLMAATYPLEIVEADRWLQALDNAALKGDPLMAALQQMPWDPSVKSLTSFPQLLHMMNTNLQWTEQLGDAFLAQQADIMGAIQRLRQRAQAAGALASTPQQTVSTEDQEIAIEPANPDAVYVPAYNPWCVYGVWPYPDEPPSSAAWNGSCASADYVLDFGPAIYPALPFWAWGAFDWRHRLVHINHDRFEHFQGGHEPPGGIWQHDPAHRHGVPYRDSATATRFGGPAGAARRELRGYAPQPTTGIAPAIRSGQAIGGRPGTMNRPPSSPGIPQRQVPPAFESFNRGAQVRGEAARGFSSRMAPPMPSMPAAPMIRSAPAGGFGGFHGGAVGGGFHGGAVGGSFHGGGGGRR